MFHSRISIQHGLSIRKWSYPISYQSRQTTSFLIWVTFMSYRLLWWCIIVWKEWLLIYRYMCGVRPRNLMRGSFTLQRHHFRFCVLRASVCRCIQRNTNTITEAPHSHHHLVKKHKSINFLFPVCCCSTYHIIHAYYHNQYHQM